MSKILLNGVTYDGIQYIQVPTEEGGVATFYKDAGGVPSIDTLDKTLLVAGNKGKIYKCDGNLYAIEEVYVPVEAGEEGTAFFLEDGKMIAPTIPAEYNVSPARFNGGPGPNDFIIRVPPDWDSSNENPKYLEWWNYDNIFYADIDENDEPAGFITFGTSVMIEPVEDGVFQYDMGIDILQWAKDNGKPFYKRILAFMRVDLPYEVHVLSYDFVVPKNEGKLYKWNGELYQIRKNSDGFLRYQKLIEYPTDFIEIDEAGDYDVTTCETVRVVLP